MECCNIFAKIISKFQKQLLPILDEFSKILKHKQPGGVIL